MKPNEIQEKFLKEKKRRFAVWSENRPMHPGTTPMFYRLLCEAVFEVSKNGVKQVVRGVRVGYK